MRPLEIIIALIDAWVLLWPAFTPRRPRWAAFLPLIAVGLVGPHLLLEKYRWQMIPLYALTGILFLFSLPQLWKPTVAARPRRWTTYLGASMSALLVAVLTAPAALFPIPVMPRPTGPYAVGTFSLHLTDSSRAEIYTDDPNDKRELMMQVWYPAAPASNAPLAPWMERLDVAAPAMAKYIRLPAFVLGHLSLIRAHAYLNAPVTTDGPFPVLVYSHGWNGFRAVHSTLMEELASQGYIVAALDHTYGAMMTVFEDGRVVFNNPAALPDGDGMIPAGQVLESVYAADVRFALDELTALNAEHFAGQVDVSRVGLLGHSTGGGAIVLACAQDARCQAGLGMDAWLVPAPEMVFTTGLSQPFLFMQSEVWASKLNEARLAQLLEASPGPHYQMTIAGTRHYDFSVLPLLSPLTPALKLKGPLNGERVMMITGAYVAEFFNHHLKGQPAPLLDGPSAAYPEVTFEKSEP